MTPAVLCVVQARAGSTRLPGKVLMDLDGRPMLAFMLRRLAGVDAEVVVATSVEPADDAVETCATDAGYAVVRGDEADVLGRFGLALDAHPADHVIRLTADCPLIDPGLVSEVLAVHLRTGADYTSNTVIRTHPDGLDVEVMTRSALEAAVAAATRPDEREHVTSHLYRRPDTYRLAACLAAGRWGHLRWTVDTMDDIERVRAMVDAGHDLVSWQETLRHLPPDDRRELTDGFEPARGGEAPAAGPVDDPGNLVLVHRVDGAMTGWVRLAIDDGGAVTSGEIDPDHIDRARQDLADFVRASAQITRASGVF